MSQPPGPVPGPRPSVPPPPSPPAAPHGPLQQLIRAQAGTAHGDATAYLSGAAHIDPAFRDAVIEELVENPHRIPPPSFGIDVVAVVKECLTARRWGILRGLILLLIPLLVLPISPIGALVPIMTLLLIRFHLAIARLVSRWSGRMARRDFGSVIGRYLRIFNVVVWLVTLLNIVSVIFFSVGLFLFPSLSAVFSGSGCDSASYGSYGGYDGDYGYDSGYGGYGSSSSCSDSAPDASAFWAAVLVVVGWTTVAAVDRHRNLRTLHLLGTGRAPKQAADRDSAAHAALFQRLRQQQSDPDVVYSDYAPFVGAGLEIDHWSFAIELVPDETRPLANGDSDTPATGAAFTVPTVHAHLRRALLRLGAAGTPPYPGDRMHGISVMDHVFKSGLRLGPASDWSGTGQGSAFARMAPYASRDAAVRELGLDDKAPAPPTWWADSLDLAAEERLRHYLAVRVGSWNDEVTLTVFTRVQMQGGLLFLENRAFLLPPIARTYHQAVDTAMPPADPFDWAGLVLRSVWSSFVLAGRSVPDLYRAARSAVRTARREAWYRRMCQANRPVNHGPSCSVRELGAEPEYQQQFQEMDVQRFMKSIETRTLTAVRECLREHGYRIDEYDRRQNVVINNGVQVHGNVTGNVQSGSHARATFQQVTAPPARVGTQQN